MFRLIRWIRGLVIYIKLLYRNEEVMYRICKEKLMYKFLEFILKSCISELIM